ncbi:SigE family RNA polymerase sigma factor [Promicromonospora sp. MEB111]|uniref:RNA polymerase sigma factor n=1 Tax=Promicromonospora sp. MEB111 TaxID=3040301 RepID=UPI00254CD3E8|nr:SigE family RNA polymerase sigma factor [Promicromonospora sp. MEB111]
MARWEEELAELVVRRGGALVGYGYSLTRDKAQAEDLVQDALVKVYSRLRRPPSVVGQTQVDLDQPEPTNAEGYVRRAMLTIYLDGYRRRSHFAGFKHLLADDEHTPGADRVATARVDVGVALARLSPRQREVVALRYFEDMTIPQIATALGLNQGTVKRHLFDATAVLRQALAEVSVPAMDTDLDDRVGTVVGATRRRRVTKVAAVAGVSMVLAVVLALSAFAVKPWIRSEPLPAEDRIEYTPGYVPVQWSAGTGVYCGMPVEELLAMDTGTFDVEISGDLVPDPQGTQTFWSLPVTVSGEVPEGVFDGDFNSMTYPLIVWAHEGRIVDLPSYWREAANVEAPGALVDHGTWTGSASADNASTCRAETLVEGESAMDSYYDNERAGGRYELIAIVGDPVRADDPEEDAKRLLVSDPVTVDLDSGVAPAPDYPAASTDCSGAAYAGRELVAPGVTDGVRAAAARLLEAVTTCDERLVVELAGVNLDTAPTPEQDDLLVNEVFALPESGGKTPYATVARLLTGTQPVNRDDSESSTWPRVATFTKNEAAWQEAVDAGVVSAEQAAVDRPAGKYSGWQLNIQDHMREGPTWSTFYEGDDEWCSFVDVGLDPECTEVGPRP